MTPSEQPFAADAAPSMPFALGRGVLRIRAHNPSPLTGTGSNCYVLHGSSGAALIDAGVDLPQHIDAIMAALAGEKLHAILITHPHLDHSGGAPKLAALTGAALYSAGPAARHKGQSGTEGADFAHRPDVLVHHGAVLTVAGLQITAWHTPGHMQGHLCYGCGDTLFSGDHVMGWATSLVAPPEGDMAAYRASLQMLQSAGYTRYLPGHGEPIDDPKARLNYLITHRNQREAQIIAALAAGTASAVTLADIIYTDLPPALLPAAALNVLAHLIELSAQGRARAAIGADGPDCNTLYFLSNTAD